MARKTTKEIKVDASKLSVKEIIEKGENAPIELRVAAIAILKDKIAQVQGDLTQLKNIESMVSSSIETVSYDDHVEEMIKSGLLGGTWEKPVFSIKTKEGSGIKVTMTGAKEDKFSIDPALSTKSTLSIVPEAYKNVSVTLNKKAIEGDYNAGILPETLKRYCSKEPIDITKLRISLVKEEKDK